MTHQFETPDFQSEQEEAQWWDAHEDDLLAAFEEAAANGTLGHGTLVREGTQAIEAQTSDPATQKNTSERKSAA
jgi:hypothetical protein